MRLFGPLLLVYFVAACTGVQKSDLSAERLVYAYCIGAYAGEGDFEESEGGAARRSAITGGPAGVLLEALNSREMIRFALSELASISESQPDIVRKELDMEFQKGRMWVASLSYPFSEEVLKKRDNERSKCLSAMDRLTEAGEIRPNE